MLNLLYGIIASAYNVTAAPPPVTPPPPPTCTVTCGQWSITYGEWSGYSPCSNGTQTRTRTVSGTRTCTASDCSTYSQTSNEPTVLGLSASATSETIACTPTTTWYCTTSYGNRYTSSTDVSFTGTCEQTVSCSTSGYPVSPPC